MNKLPPHSQPKLQLLLLDLIAPSRPVTQSQVDALTSADWLELHELVRRHRLGPMLYWQLEGTHSHLSIPPDNKAVLAQSYKKAAMRSLLLQRELLLVQQIFKKADIPYVALKGAFLAYHAYPEAALRPLRDLDILVPKDRVLEAFQALLEGGLTRMAKYPGTPRAVMLVSHHLPPIRSASGQVTVELHSRLFDHEKDGIGQADLSDTQEFWDRCVQLPLANEAITFESPTDLLLHMIEHAVYHHKFDNGPLLLSDLAFLIKSQEIDWSLFWDLARKGQQTQGCFLALRLMQRYWKVENIVWPELPSPDLELLEEPLNVAAWLMLRDRSMRDDISFHREIERAVGWLGKIEVLLGKLFPPKTKIASNYPVSSDSWQVYLWYPVKWHHQLTNRLFGFFRFRQQRYIRPEVGHIAQLDQWLSGKK